MNQTMTHSDEASQNGTTATDPRYYFFNVRK
jgi:hypothetical protein